MTAPAAPRISAVRQNGGFVRISWAEVQDATDYNIYLDSAPAPTGLEDSVSDAEGEGNGYFEWWSPEQIGQVYIRITALNALAEESAYSNEVYRYMTSDSDGMSDIPAPLTEAHDIHRKN